jgi:hypothetical protein
METGWWGEFHDSYGVVFPRLVGMRSFPTSDQIRHRGRGGSLGEWVDEI